MEAFLLETLNRTFQQSVFRYSMIVLLTVVSISSCVVVIAHAKKKKERLSNRQKKLLTTTAILVILLPFVMSTDIIAMKRDIEDRQIIEAYGHYTLDATVKPRNSWTINGRVYVTIDGESITLKLPAGWTYDSFPEGNYWGKVYYSQDSLIILHFLPDQPLS